VTHCVLKVTNHRFNPAGCWSRPIDSVLFQPLAEDFELFDQNGYDLTPLEQRFARANHRAYHSHREHRQAIKQTWFEQDYQIEGAILNHSNLFERKGYGGAAREQLLAWSHAMPRCHILLALRPKWGLDFSMDYVDRSGNAFELLHWEYDGFDHDEVDSMRERMTPVLAATDWSDAAQRLLQHKSEWHDLDFFGQSAWKCRYFGIPNERFKMVAWA